MRHPLIAFRPTDGPSTPGLGRILSALTTSRSREPSIVIAILICGALARFVAEVRANTLASFHTESYHVAVSLAATGRFADPFGDPIPHRYRPEGAVWHSGRDEVLQESAIHKRRPSKSCAASRRDGSCDGDRGRERDPVGRQDAPRAPLIECRRVQRTLHHAEADGEAGHNDEDDDREVPVQEDAKVRRPAAFWESWKDRQIQVMKNNEKCGERTHAIKPMDSVHGDIAQARVLIG
jgi:hypothetical protein